MTTKNSIQVAIKLRPLIGREKDLTSCWRVVDNSIQLLDSQSEPFYFDHIFDQDIRNSIIFEKMAKHIVHSAIEGFNGTIFAYGQTSSGKTYTMMGDDTNPGVMVLAAKEIFKQILNASDRQFLLRVGYIEIYNERIYDLLNKKNQDLKIHDTNTGVSVNCEEIVITSEEDLLNILNAGSKERTVGETNINERSSRSHAIFRITIESRKVDRSEDDTVIESVINLVDLAGSERANQTGATGARLKEGGHINKSLMFLSNVIKNLSENEDHKYISYRDSKLTRILQASLGGNALTAIICTIKPTAIEETQSTLSFAMRAKTIKNKPLVNETVSDATMMKRLENEIKHLKTSLSEEQKKNQSKIKVCQLEEQIKNTLIKIISVNSLSNVRKTKDARRRTWCSTSVMDESSVLVSNQDNLRHPNKENIHVADQSDIMEDEEEFATEPSPKITNDHWDTCKTPPKITKLRVNVTPKLAVCAARNLQIVENALSELEELTNLENTIPVKHDAYAALKEKMDILQERNAMLENKRLEYLQLKSYFDLTKEELIESEKRCDQLQIQVSKLLNDHAIYESKERNYETELQTLRNRVKELEMENREAVNREFEFERHQYKCNVRETELLGALSEERNCQRRQTESLQQIQSKYALIQAQYTHLQKEYESLQLGSIDTMNENTKLKVENSDLQCQIKTYIKLKEEYDNIKISSLDILNENTKLKEENDNNHCLYRELNEKYETLKIDNLHENTKLKEENYTKQRHYRELNEQYEALNSSSMDTVNDNNELNKLRPSNVESESELLQSLNHCNNVESFNDLKEKNCKLQDLLSATNSQFQELLKENDQLSNQLMCCLQEGDDLREKCKSMEDELKSIETNSNITEKISPNKNNADLLRKFEEISEFVHEIELELRHGKSRVFISNVATIASETENSGNKCYKLLLNKVEDISIQNTVSTSESSAVIQGFLHQHKFHIVELDVTNESNIKNKSKKKYLEIEVEKQREAINTLTKENQYLCDENKSLLESTQRTVQEMRDQIMRLSSELFEKSMFLEKCACGDYQRQIICLEKERSDITTVCTQLKERVDRHYGGTGESNVDLRNEFLKKSDTISILEIQRDDLETKCAANLNNLPDFKRQCDEKLENMQNLMVLTETNLREENRRLQLELYEKLEINETLSRDLLRKTRLCEEADELRKSIKYELCQLHEELSRVSKKNNELQSYKSKQEINASSMQLKISEIIEALNKCKEKELELEIEIRLLREDKKQSADAHSRLLSENTSLKASYDNLSILNKKLDVKLEEASRRHDELLQEKFNDMEQVVQECAAFKNENIALKQKFETLKVQKEQLDCKLCDISEENELLKSRLSDSSITANERYEQLKDQLNVKLEKIDGLEENIVAMKSKYEKSIEILKNENIVLQDCLDKQNEEKKNIVNMVEILRCKIETLSHELQEANDKLLYCVRMHDNYDFIKLSFDELKLEANSMKTEMEEIRIKLEQATNRAECSEKISESQKSQICRLEQELQKSNLIVKEFEVRKKQQLDLQSSLQELQYKCSSLEESKISLQEKYICLKQQLQVTLNVEKECVLLKLELEESIKEKGHIQEHVKSLRDELTKLKNAHKEQSCMLDNKESSFKEDKAKLEATISGLLLEKKSMDEKLYATEICNKRLEQELISVQTKTDCANTSIESTRNSCSRKSLDRTCTESNQLKANEKIYSKRQMSIQKNQKNRRLSSYDENRPQASWDTTRDVAIMTDPIDANCNCIVLDKKLKDSEKELFIRESQVAALKMELRNHPMITENEVLKKRLDQEQEINLLQIRKYKEIIIEQRTKSNLVSVESQTEFDLDATFQKLQGKYNDVKNICRSRYTFIKKLETQISTQSDQLKTLQTQYETANKELKIYKLKYNDAKGILALRLDEIRTLRALLREPINQ